jgi:prepilin signal peptidase PulO-like enzyme (type II secretory pathway)
VVAIVGAVAFAATEARFEGDVPSLVLIGVVVAAMVVLFATDLDQRLLPDLITYPLVALAILAWLVNLRPYVRTTEDLVWAAVAAVGIPFALFLLSIPFGAGAIGLGDLKLLAGVGLLAGALRLFYALVVGAALAGGIVLLLVASRRISLRSYVPYGPFLILGSMWAILALVQT